MSQFVYYAPVLPSEGWTSIDRYRDDYEAFLPRYCPELTASCRLPNESKDLRGWRRRWTRDYLYPAQLRMLSRDAPRGSLLHVFDHSYAHLCKTWQPTLLHCRDLNHLVLPSLTGLALIRWKQRLAGLQKATGIIAISEQLSSEIQEHIGIPEDRIRVLHHGVDLECYRPNRAEEARAHFPQLAEQAKDSFLVLNIGTNLPRKNLETIYAAIRSLKERGVPVKLVRIGENISVPGEAERIASFGLSDDVLQLGLLDADEVSLVCNLSHVLSFASLYEGFGRPLLEAQACGLPLVAANASCLPEIAGNGALYHEPTSWEDLAENLLLVFEKNSRIEDLRELGFKNCERFSWERHLKSLVAIYSEFSG